MMTALRTQVGIVGAGPAGLLLAHLLHLEGIDSVVVENRSRNHVSERVRAGVLEQGTVDLLIQSGLGDRLRREGIRHGGIHLAFSGTSRRIDFEALTGGSSTTVYGQTEVVKDLIQARCASGRPLYFECQDVTVEEVDTARPLIHFRTSEGHRVEVACDILAGCDGFHGICRAAIPETRWHSFERVYPFAWLGILAQAAPSCDELVYVLHDRGFALSSMRSAHVTRLYLQCSPDEQCSQWADERIWNELDARLPFRANRGTILQKSVTGMRSFVAEPMQYGRLFLAGDAAHIVPPTGAKGLNLAVRDVRVLAEVISDFYRNGTQQKLDSYTQRCLRHVWKAQRFSWWMTSMLHRAPDGNEFDYRRQIAELDYVTSSRAAMTTLAENYVGTALDG